MNTIPVLASRLRSRSDATVSGQSAGHSASNEPDGNSARFERLEERMDLMQTQILATQRMMRELSVLVHRQIKMSHAKNHQRSYSEHTPPTSYELVTVRGPSLATLGSIFRPTFMATESSHSLVVTDDRYISGGSIPQSDRSSTIQEVNETSELQVPQKRQSKQLAVRDAMILSDSPIPENAPSNPTRDTGLKFHNKSRELADAMTDVEALTTGAAKKQSAQLTRRFSISSVLPDRPPANHPVKRVARWFMAVRMDPVVSPEEIRTERDSKSKVHPFTIHHDSPQRAIWDTLVMLLILMDIVITPLSLAYDYAPWFIMRFNITGSCIFALDFLVNIFSSYTSERGELISGPSKTARHYLLSVWAIPDLLSFFPFEIFVADRQGRFLGIAKVIRLAKVSQLARKVHSAKKAGIVRFTYLLGIVFLVSHTLSCYWYWVAIRWREHIDEGIYVPRTMFQNYVHCWALVIGSLNASPPMMYTPIEEASVALFMLVGNVLQATVFGSVAVLISSFDEEEAAYNKKLITTIERCKFLGIPDDLTRRIRGYYENLYRETKSVSPDGDSFINELSPALICEVKFQLYRDMIKQIPFLSAKKIDPTVIELLILHLRTVIYMQDDVLIRKGECGDWMGFIGSKGSVGVLDPSSNVRKIIRILRKGDYFGEMALLQRAKRSTTAIALTWVQIHVLCRNDLDDVKEQYPSQAEILEQEINKYMQSKVRYK